jgi:hypothetical protein
MIPAFPFNRRKILLLGLISYYAVICLFSFVAHNHSPDLDFHDTCPACQWQVLTQENDTCTSMVLCMLCDPLVFVGPVSLHRCFIPALQYFYKTNLSRAPPSST